MKKLLYLLLLVLLSLGKGLLAQDEAIFNHYIQSPILLNPAAAGFTDEYQLQLNARSAWAGFDNAPRTMAVRLNGPIGESFGIGAAVINESAAQINRIKGQLDVAIRLGFGQKVKGVVPFQMAFGFFTQFERITLDPELVTNPLIQAGDDLISTYLNGQNNFDAAVGIYGSYMNNTFGGLTINNLVSNRLDNISGVSNSSNVLNYTFLFGHRFRIESLDLELTPSVMMRNVQGAPFMMDLNLQAGFLSNKLITGLSYRYLGALGLLLGTQLDGFFFYYSYDLSFANFQSYSNGSHELTVGYRIDRGKLKKKREQKAREQNK